MIPKFKKGDVVMINSDLSQYSETSVYFTPSMKYHIGKKVIVKKYHDNGTYTFEGIERHFLESNISHTLDILKEL